MSVEFFHWVPMRCTRFIPLPDGTQALYHAVAVVASNDRVILLGRAVEILSVCGLSGREAFALLAPLVRGTLTNIERMGIADALTGPIERGDAATVGHHRRALATQRPDLLLIYQILGLSTLELAGSRKEFGREAIGQLRALLADAPVSGPSGAG